MLKPRAGRCIFRDRGSSFFQGGARTINDKTLKYIEARAGARWGSAPGVPMLRIYIPRAVAAHYAKNMIMTLAKFMRDFRHYVTCFSSRAAARAARTWNVSRGARARGRHLDENSDFDG